jgi:hypothetical protein
VRRAPGAVEPDGRRNERPFSFPRRLIRRRVHPIDSKVDTCDVVAFVGCEEQRSRGHPLGTTQTAERAKRYQHCPELVGQFPGGELTIDDRSFNPSRADRVDTNLSVLQFRRPGSDNRTKRRLGCGIRAVARNSLYPCDRPIENDRSSIIPQRQTLLDGEIHTASIDIESLVEMLRSDRRVGTSSTTPAFAKRMSILPFFAETVW